MSFRGPAGDSSASRKSKTPPPDDTHQEAAYLKALGEKQRPVKIKLIHGDVIKGWIEYYDRRMIRVTREGAPNLFIFKHEIAYIAEEPIRKSRSDGAAAKSDGDGSE